MEIIFEVLVELVGEIVVECAKSKRLSKWIRYPLIALIVLFWVAVIGLMLFIGIKSYSTDRAISLICLGLAAIFILFSVIRLVKGVR